MNIKETAILDIYNSDFTTGSPVETIQQQVEISLEELDNIATDAQKLALWQQIADAIAEVRDS